VISILKGNDGLKIFLSGLWFNLMETLWFGRGSELGFNIHPASKGELICDYIAVAIMVVGFFFMFKSTFITIRCHNLYINKEVADESTNKTSQ